MSKRGAAIELVDRPKNEVAGSDDLSQALTALEGAHMAYERADSKNHDAIADKGRQIQKLIEERQKLIDARKDARRYAKELIQQADHMVDAFLADPDSAIHPVLAAVILAPGSGDGSLQNSNTFNGVKNLALEFYDLHNYQEQQETPQPVVWVNNRFDYQKQKKQPQINFSYTIPEAGLAPESGQRITAWHSSGITEYGPQPLLTLPIEEDRFNAVSPSAYNSHYVWASGAVVGVNHFGRSAPKGISPDDYVPQVAKLELPLPVGNLDSANTAKPFVYYDREDEVKVIELPKVIGVGNPVVCAIGEQAIVHLFTDMQSSHSGSNAEQRRVMRNLSLTVAHKGLGLAIKRRDFRRHLGHS